MKKPEQDISKLLNELKAKSLGLDGYKAPQGYFESLPERIMKELPGTRFQKSTPQNNLYSSKTLIALLAAATILIFVFIYYTKPGQEALPTAAAIDTQNLKNAYDASYAGDVASNEIQLVNELLEELSSEDNISFINLEDSSNAISDEVIIEYLNSQEIDPGLLAELSITP